LQHEDDVFDHELAHVVLLCRRRGAPDHDRRGSHRTATPRTRPNEARRRETSTFLVSSVAASFAVLAGDQRTPSGLLVVT